MAEKLKETLMGIFGNIAIIAAIVGGVFWILNEFLDLDFAATIAYYGGATLAMSIYSIIVVGVLFSDWTEATFFKLVASGILLAVVSYVVYYLFSWEIFYTVCVGCAVVAAFAAVLGLLKAIFFGCD